MVELAKALSLEERTHAPLTILLDEPTSVLEAKDIKILFERIRNLKSRASFVSSRTGSTKFWRSATVST